MSISEIVLRGVLVFGGAFVVFTGIDFAFGGIISLGLEGKALPASIAAVEGFHERDSHTRFLGGVWLGVGLVFLAAAVRLQALKSALLASIALIFIGGLARFTTGAPEVLVEPAIAVSLGLELIGMPVLYYWVSRVRAGQA